MACWHMDLHKHHRVAGAAEKLHVGPQEFVIKKVKTTINILMLTKIRLKSGGCSTDASTKGLPG